jgi:hypothetical protein
METFKIVIHTGYGGFELSDEAFAMFCERKNIAADERGITSDAFRLIERLNQTHRIERDDPDLIAVVETLGVLATRGPYTSLKVVEVPMWLREKGWYIVDDEGFEHISEKCSTWS